jgi:Protein of unknown function (DUF1580)
MTAECDPLSAVAATDKIDLIHENVVSFTELARRLPRRRQGSPTHVSTLHRWRLNGLKGVRLQAIRLGGAWATSMEAYQRFCDALTEKTERDPKTERARAGAHQERTEQLLSDCFDV